MLKNKTNSMVVLALVTGFMLGPLTSVAIAGPSKKPSLKQDSTKSLLGLKSPISVADAKGFRDGGSIYVALVDATGRKESLSFDYQIRSQTQGRLYIGAAHRTMPGAKLVPLGSNVEKQVISLLQRHLDRQYSRSGQKALFTLGASEGLSEVRKRHGEKGVQACYLLRGISGLKALSAKRNMKGKVLLLDSTTGKIETTLSMGRGTGSTFFVPPALAFSPDGKHLFARGKNAILFWDLK